MLTVWGRRSSFNLQKVMWLVDELQLSHEHLELGGRFGVLDTPEFRALNPHRKVPVIRDPMTGQAGDREDTGVAVVWESHAILRFLAARYGQRQFWTRDLAARARHDQWMDWAQTELQPDFLMGVFWGFYRTPEAARDTRAIERSVSACAAHFQLIDNLLQGCDYLLGPDLGLADIPIATCLYRYFNLEIERPSLPNVESWYARLCERPAYQKNVMVAFDDLYGRLAF